MKPVVFLVGLSVIMIIGIAIFMQRMPTRESIQITRIEHSIEGIKPFFPQTGSCSFLMLNERPELLPQVRLHLVPRKIEPVKTLNEGDTILIVIPDTFYHQQIADHLALHHLIWKAQDSMFAYYFISNTAH